jgi:hypothetical protein
VSGEIKPGTTVCPSVCKRVKRKKHIQKMINFMDEERHTSFTGKLLKY